MACEHGGSPDSFGAQLRRLREGAGLSQEELGERAGLTGQAVGALERGARQRPYPETVRRLVDALGLSAEARAALFAAVPRRGLPPGRRPDQAGMGAEGVRLAPDLPAPLTALVGREGDVAAVLALLCEGTRLLTLTGPGGVGKTRLALAVATAEAVRDRFPDGVAFVALASLADSALVVPTIAHTFSLRAVGGHTLPALLQASLAAKRLLLVLDNCEHVLAAAPEIAALLAACPSLVALVTSRAPLRLRGEQEYPVAPLALPDLTRVPTPDEVAQSPAVRLFVDRARAASPAFALTGKNAVAVAAICRRLDGLPLALELAAARVKLLPPVALLARLDRALPLLVGGTRDLPARQQTMRDAIAWSHALLGVDERAVFRRLAVFAGGWTVDAAEAVCRPTPESIPGDAAVVDALAALLDNSLITLMTATEGNDGDDGEDGGPRFAILETVRAYALEELVGHGEEDEIRGRHAAYYGALALAAEARLKGAEQAAWLDRLGREADNLREALTWLLQHGATERVVRIGWALWSFWSARGHPGEGQRWMEQALARGDLLTPAMRARARASIGAHLWVQGRPAHAAALLDESIADARAAGDMEALAGALLSRGFAAVDSGEAALADAPLVEALALHRDRGDGWGIGTALVGLAQVALARGDTTHAARLLEEGEAVVRAAGNPFTLAVNLNVQAMMAQLGGDGRRAAALLGESVRLSATLRDTWAMSYGLIGLGGLAARQGQGERAARLFGAAEALRDTTAIALAYPAAHTMYEQDLSVTRALLDTDTFGREWARGRAMSLDEVIADALAISAQT